MTGSLYSLLMVPQPGGDPPAKRFPRFATLDDAGGVLMVALYDWSDELMHTMPERFRSVDDASEALAGAYPDDFRGWWYMPEGMDSARGARTHDETRKRYP